MKSTRPKTVTDSSPDMTPFIDCVFLLIVFFMTVSRFSTQEYETLKLPNAKSGQEKLPKKKKKLVINLNVDGDTIIGGRHLNPLQLESQLTMEARLNDGPENVIVIVRADRQARFEYIQDLMITCARAGVWQLSFAVVSEPVPD
jgi:biopolymer transport protein ExbD